MLRCSVVLTMISALASNASYQRTSYNTHGLPYNPQSDFRELNTPGQTRIRNPSFSSYVLDPVYHNHPPYYRSSYIKNTVDPPTKPSEPDHNPVYHNHPPYYRSSYIKNTVDPPTKPSEPDHNPVYHNHPPYYRSSYIKNTVDPPTKPSEPDSHFEESITTVRGRKVNRGDLIFEDHFDTLDLSKWRREIRIPLDTDDADFVLYENYTENCYIKNGKLYITANPLDEVPGYDKHTIRYGEIDLGARCTGVVDTDNECKRKAGFSTILPPIVSARLSTKESFSFRYGKIEVRAKLPKGDWLFPLITLDPLTSDYGVLRYASGQMRVAFIRGNVALVTQDNVKIDGSYLAGGVIFKNSSSNDRVRRFEIFHETRHWGNEFHTYELTWTDSSISLGVDGEIFDRINGGFHQNSLTSMAPFDKEFYITLALSAGGISDFPDKSFSGTYCKPWDNSEPKAQLNFYKAKDKWHRTWTQQDSRLVIDYVKVWAL